MEQQVQSMAFLIGAMALISLVETIIPGRRDATLCRNHLPPNIILMILTFAVNIAFNSFAVAFAEAVDIYQLSIFSLDGAFWLVLAIGVVCLDFFAYVAHRLMHVVPWLWRVHRIHHSELLVDVTTAYRQHPAEAAWRSIFTILPAWALGIPAEIIVVYKSISALFALLEHTNIQIWKPIDVAFSGLFVTPNMHKIHHSRIAVETDSNFGNIFSIFDRLLGTFTPQKPLSEIHYGLDGMDEAYAQSISGLLRHPFRKPIRASQQ